MSKLNLTFYRPLISPRCFPNGTLNEKSLAQLTADYWLRADLQGLRGPVGMRDSRAEDHAASRRLLLASTLKHPSLLGESVLHVDVALLQDAHAVAGHHHLLGWIHLNLNHNGPVDFALHTGRGVLSADTACLVKHMGCHSTQIGADEHLQARRLVVANQPDDREAIPGAVLHRSA